MTHRWMVLRLEAPLMAFGGVAIDQVGPTREVPAISMLIGLFGNALGWDWNDRAAHQALQDRLVFGAVTLREGETVTDQQNARVYEGETAWTTRGPESRNKGPSYAEREPDSLGGRKYLTHRRRRDYLADAAVGIVLRFEPATIAPTLSNLAEALDRPARPLFIGRKPCLPTARLLGGEVEGACVHDALQNVANAGGKRAVWPQGEGPDGARVVDLADLRVWQTGLHGGSRRVVEGKLPCHST